MGGAVFRLFRGERHSWGYKGVLYVPNLGAHMEDYKIFNKLTERINNSRRMHVTDVTGWYSDAVRGGTNLKIRESKDDDSRELGDLVINKRNELSFDMKEYVRDSSTLIARIAQVGVCSTVGISSFVFPLVTTRMLDMAMLAAVFGCGLPGMCEVLVGEFVSMMSHRDHPSIGPIGAIPYLGARLHYKRKALNLNARLNSAIDNHGDYRVLESEFGDSRKMARAESRFAREMQFLDRIYDNTNNGKGLVLECERHDRQDVVEFFERLLDQRLVDRIKRR